MQGNVLEGLSAQELEDIRHRRAKADRDSRKLGEKLLQGWCMLNDCCPVCLTVQNNSHLCENFV